MSNPENNKKRENPEKPHFNVLVIGKSGSGKSTAINMFFNMAKNLNYQNERIIAINQHMTFQGVLGDMTIVKLDCNLDQFKETQSKFEEKTSQSQTKECNIYTIENEKYILSFVDTPGLSDTKGKDADDRHINNIINKIKELASISAILYVHRSIDCRMDLSLQSYINKFKSILTKDCQENFIVCFTNVVNSLKIDSLKVLEESGLRIDNYVYFENDCLLPPTMIKCSTEKKQKLYFRISEQLWESNQEQFDYLISLIIKMTPQKSSFLYDEQIKKESIVKLISDRQFLLKTLVLKQFEYHIKISEEEGHLSSLLNNKKMTKLVKKKKLIQVKVHHLIQKKLDRKATFCSICRQLCHDPCFLQEIYLNGGYNLKYCYTFNKFGLCKCNHFSDSHRHTQNIEEEVTEIKEQEKEFYEEVQCDKDDFKKRDQDKIMVQSIINDLKLKAQHTKKITSDNLKEIAVLYELYNETSLKPISNMTEDYILDQLDLAQKEQTFSTKEKDLLSQNFNSVKKLFETYRNEVKSNDFISEREMKTILKEFEKVKNERKLEVEESIAQSKMLKGSHDQKQQNSDGKDQTVKGNTHPPKSNGGSQNFYPPKSNDGSENFPSTRDPINSNSLIEFNKNSSNQENTFPLQNVQHCNQCSPNNQQSHTFLQKPCISNQQQEQVHEKTNFLPQNQKNSDYKSNLQQNYLEEKPSKQTVQPQSFSEEQRFQIQSINSNAILHQMRQNESNDTNLLNRYESKNLQPKDSNQFNEVKSKSTNDDKQVNSRTSNIVEAQVYEKTSQKIKNELTSNDTAKEKVNFQFSHNNIKN